MSFGEQAVFWAKYQLSYTRRSDIRILSGVETRLRGFLQLTSSRAGPFMHVIKHSEAKRSQDVERQPCSFFDKLFCYYLLASSTVSQLTGRKRKSIENRRRDILTLALRAGHL